MGVRTYQGIEDGQNMTPVIDHARKNIAKLGIAFRFAVPLRKNNRGYLDVPAKLVRGMATQK